MVRCDRCSASVKIARSLDRNIEVKLELLDGDEGLLPSFKPVEPKEGWPMACWKAPIAGTLCATVEGILGVGATIAVEARRARTHRCPQDERKVS